MSKKQRKINLIKSMTIIIVISCIFFFGYRVTHNKDNKDIFTDISKSHINRNIPSNKNKFKSLLQNDLQKYFISRYNSNVTVIYSFLREGSTQVGLAYPKYYLWVIIKKDKDIIDRGAVRVAAIDKAKFEVTHFVSYIEIKKNNKDIFSIFPKPVCKKIEEKIEE